MSSIWSLRFQCSASCKKKETHRQVTCIDARNSHVNDSFCDPSTRPPSIKMCRSRPCRYLVVTGDSSQVRLRKDVNTFCSWEKELSLKSGAVEPGGTLNVGTETGMCPVSGAKPPGPRQAGTAEGCVTLQRSAQGPPGAGAEGPARGSCELGRQSGLPPGNSFTKAELAGGKPHVREGTAWQGRSVCAPANLPPQPQ